MIKERMVYYDIRRYLKSSGLEFRRAIITMTATLGTFGTSLALQRISHQNLSTLVLSVVLALTLSRMQRPGGARARLPELAVVPLVALSAGELAHLLLSHPTVGDLAFTCTISGAMCLRQVGRLGARIGQLVSLPITGILVVPAIGFGFGPDARLWQVTAALVALFWVSAVQLIADHFRYLPPHRRGVPFAASTAAGNARRLSGHSRMALQLAVAVGAAFVIGRTAFPGHWNWTVLTAIIVCGGGPSRGEVMVKGASRLLGAGVGTLVATLLSSSFPGHHDDTVVLIFVLLFLGAWWREISYAVWAGCVTCVMALLSGYFGQPVGTLLSTRLEAIFLGAICAIVACTLVMPTPTAALVRRRRSLALQSLASLLHGMRTQSPAVPLLVQGFDARMLDLRRAAQPLRLQHTLARAIRTPDRYLLATVDAVLACAAPARQAVGEMSSLQSDDQAVALWQTSAGLVEAHVGRTRRQLAGHSMPHSGPEHGHVFGHGLLQLNEAVLAIVPPDQRASGSRGTEHVAQVDEGAPHRADDVRYRSGGGQRGAHR